MARPVSPTAYGGLGAVAGVAGVACVGAASVSVQLDGAGWWALGAMFAVAAVALFVLAVRLVLRARMNPPSDERRLS